NHVLKYVPCENTNQGSCAGNDARFSPGWVSFALAGDVGILLGKRGRFWIGVDWYVDFPPDIAIGPLAGTNIPAQFQTNGGATVIHGPQFFIGPALGVDFGH